MPKVRTILLLVLGALVVFAGGYFTGRWMLLREWGNPLGAVTPEAAKRAAVEGADPTPAAGTRVFQPLPLRRMRETIKPYVEKDPVVMKVGTFSRDEEKSELILWLENRGDCKATRVAGVAYGYHASGQATPVNKAGETYVAFDIAKDVSIDPKATGNATVAVKNAGVASLAVAHLDMVECEGGKVWKRQ